MTTIEILKADRELISDPNRWTQGAMARDEWGNKVFPSMIASGVRWSAEGAIAVAGTWHWMAGQSVVVLMETASLPPGTMSAFNDNHTHAEVLDLFDRTIARLSQEQPQA